MGWDRIAALNGLRPGGPAVRGPPRESRAAADPDDGVSRSLPDSYRGPDATGAPACISRGDYCGQG
ncbi:hypothetical protein OH791_23090 [Streptomyces anulatus]|uniref:hypothetical protein n=1 Tax=Streptomyces anulatus TaxID=1892 RepID=UPI0033CDCCEA|nr:hypothetical protein OH791_23090 [Streptomyces anulatus]